MIFLRGLAFIIDLICVYFTSFFLISRVEYYDIFASTLSLLLFFVYNVICLLVWDGQTIGKFFARLKVYSNNHIFSKVNFPYLIREVSKLLYLLPGFIGLAFFMISFVFYLFYKTTLQDFFANTYVNLKEEYNGE
ncbi:RDD family protein [Tuanshanicoccus lijuaniae]|uniref:RDD family protein n=1 Tax=Aerococcaceae bacterium zg-1292 TaxID=2774330 RepID=UPI001BD8D754|nr:RDD family protein [Aerococcaceae bacterium zg-A91]MBS4458533.1 RDD family protein [Aerococcaceae bacterium zg-BR33]